jgi:mitochondrial import inner membrane translocase subunit TIM44
MVQEVWAEEVREQLAKQVIKAHLEGNIRKWKEWLGEAVYEKLSADIRARKTDGLTFDPNVMNIDDNMIVMKVLDNGSPVIVVVYVTQQINCIRKKGEIIEVSQRTFLLLSCHALLK